MRDSSTFGWIRLAVYTSKKKKEKNGRQPQNKWKTISKKMEDNLKKNEKIEDDLQQNKMEDDLQKKEDNLKKNKKWKMT
jgi:hypothetical protein